MNKHRSQIAPTLAVAAATLALFGCASAPSRNAELEQASSDYRLAQSSSQLRELAPAEMKLAAEALAKANGALSNNDKPDRVTHLAYLAKQQVAVAQEAGRQKSSELAVAAAGSERDKMRLAARTNEADAAQRSADAAMRQSEASQREALASRQLAEASQQVANEAQLRTARLETLMKEMNAKQTDRGMVITIGDVLFDTNRAQLKQGSQHSLEKLSGFLKEYPQRNARVEGFTDSVGSEANNQALSGRRADAVRLALVHMGIGAERISMQGYGEAFPVAGNDSADGRQLNRRVEVLLSDDKGVIVPR
jgi:outer membrane protein OmpA-like peptidoglycan-associated protein